MLDKTDLEQIKELLQPIQNTLAEHGNVLAEHGNVIAEHSNELAEQRNELAEQGKALAEQGKVLAEHRKVLVENSNVLAEHGTEIVSVNLTLENKIIPMLNLLLEGQKTIVDNLVPVSRVEDLEEEVKLLKIIVRQISEDVQQLKKAQ